MSEIKLIFKNVFPQRQIALWGIFCMLLGPVAATFGLLLAVCAVCDINGKIVPNIIPLAISLLGVTNMLIHLNDGILSPLISFTATALGVMAIKAAFRSGFGFGDVKLLISCGTLLPFGRIMAALGMACISAAAVGLFKSRKMKAEIALVPYLSAAIFALFVVD